MLAKFPNLFLCASDGQTLVSGYMARDNESIYWNLVFRRNFFGGKGERISFTNESWFSNSYPINEPELQGLSG